MNNSTKSSDTPNASSRFTAGGRPVSYVISWLVVGIVVGIIIGISAYLLLLAPGSYDAASGKDSHHLQDTSKPDEPLYWVAPMDPNFKRDKPGKSPMGMDLVPVYAKDLEGKAMNDSPGTVTIDPLTVQNLGVKTGLVESIVPSTLIIASGQVQYAQDSVEHVHSRVEGWIENLSVRASGEYIEKGEPLYAIYSPELVNAQEEFVIALSQNNTALINAAKARLGALEIPQSTIQEIEKTRKVTQSIAFSATQSGFVDELNIQQGFYVKPSMTMMSIAPLDKVWVIADVFPKDASMLSIGQHAIITSPNLPGQAFHAELDYIYPSLSASTRTVQVRFTVDNSQFNRSTWLRPQMYTTVQIPYSPKDDSGEKQHILAVPKQAVIRTGKSDRVVMALDEGKYKSVNVRLGRDFDDVFEILDGLSEGDKVVTSAQFLIDSESSISSDFMRMTPLESPEATHSVEETSVSAWTEARVNEIDFEQRKVNLTHGYLDAFDMMGMTMDFTVSPDIDMNDFVLGENVHVEIIREPSGMFQVKTLHVMDKMADDEMVDDEMDSTHGDHP
uniref:efflux RND transporter periplasmic adaptor subunit n=1 Tax=Ningiella ruwaisensis TaxID=2364274 RepID=UPI00109F5EA3|nr:efflux RND transporter periplasmic adaptor subunit [Ningiella ruwaisensis]